MLIEDRSPLLECACCNKQHRKSERIPKPNPKYRNLSDLVCPNCGGKTYHLKKPE